MDESNRRSLIGTTIAVVIGALVTWALSDGSQLVGSVAVVAICAALAYLVNWVAFVPAYLRQTEKFYDLTGSITYLAVIVAAVVLSDDLDTRSWVVAAMVAVWTLRLGTFLFRRISRDGGDGRFDAIKTNALRFFMTWTIQALWVLFTAAAALTIITGTERVSLGWVGYLGIAVWVVGFAIEVVADRQKSTFKADPANKGAFITTGLWSWSRHPNYFGEIVLWLGVAILAVPVLEGWRWVALISPVFVYLLITRVSGVPMLEKRGMDRWGDDPAYQAYVERTSELVPLPPKR